MNYIQCISVLPHEITAQFLFSWHFAEATPSWSVSPQGRDFGQAFTARYFLSTNQKYQSTEASGYFGFQRQWESVIVDEEKMSNYNICSALSSPPQ